MGYAGRILDVNLSSGKITEFQAGEEERKRFIGGKGIAFKILYNELKAGTEPLSEGNLLIFMTGPLTGTSAPSSGRFCCVSKSPLTGTIFDSHCGGYFGYELKRAGFDGIIVRGKSDDRVFLNVKNEKAELLDASRMWGKDTRETEARIKKATGASRVLCIGVAGENLVRYAAIIHEGHRALGRGGLGAVMGSKNLKAVCVKGNGKIPISDPASFKAIVRGCNELLKKNPSTRTLKKYGTPNVLTVINDVGLLPTRNFKTGFFEDADKISAEELSKFVSKSYGCFSCQIRCGKAINIEGTKTESLEYETLYAFGPNCGNSDLKSIVAANELCNRFGLDTISTGATIAFFIELVERGYVDYDIRWGDSKGILDLVKKISCRKGVGDILAEGTRRVSEKFKTDFSIQVKGLELPGYDPRGAVGTALGYATSNEGASHMRSPIYVDEILSQRVDRFKREGKVEMLKDIQDFHASVDSLIVCKFTTRVLDEFICTRLLKHATGIDFDLMRAGERIFNIARLFNLREGFSSADDAIPKRLLEEEIPTGNSKGSRADLSNLGEYYEARGWSKVGVPTKEKLDELDIRP